MSPHQINTNQSNHADDVLAAAVDTHQDMGLRRVLSSGALAQAGMRYQLERMEAQRRRERRVRWVKRLGLSLTAAVPTATALVFLVQSMGTDVSENTSTRVATNSPGAVDGTATHTNAPGGSMAWPDGVRLTTSPKARFDVAHRDDKGMTVTLAQGRLRMQRPKGVTTGPAAIAARADSKPLAEPLAKPPAEWKVMAGPFQIRVLGARFETDFEAEWQDDRLTVRVNKGQATVTGGARSTRWWPTKPSLYGRKRGSTKKRVGKKRVARPPPSKRRRNLALRLVPKRGSVAAVRDNQ